LQSLFLGLTAALLWGLTFFGVLAMATAGFGPRQAFAIV